MLNEIFERIDNLMRHKGKRNKELLDYLKIDRNAYNNWKNGKSYSFIKYIDEIADFLQVSSRFLLLGNVDNDTKTNQEIELLIYLEQFLQHKEIQFLLLSSSFQRKRLKLKILLYHTTNHYKHTLLDEKAAGYGLAVIFRKSVYSMREKSGTLTSRATVSAG